MLRKNIVAVIAASFFVVTGTAVAQPVSGVEETNRWYAELLADELVSEDIIQNAVEYAHWAADSRIPYDYNPTFNKIDNFDGRLNCSELVWRAYWNGGKGIDLDGGNKLKPGVFPRDIIASPYLSRY